MTGSTLFSLTRFDRASNLQFIQTIKFLSMDSRYLQSFVYVAELGSIAEAARRLDLTPAAVGQRVKLLEEELGMRLIQRSGRTVSATPAGARILERGRKVLRDIRDLRADVVDDTSLSGELRLGATPTLMTALIPRLVSTLLGEHPQVDIYLEPGNSVALYSKVLDGELDAALIIRPLFDLPKSWAGTRCGRSPWCCSRPSQCKSPTYASRSKPSRFSAMTARPWAAGLPTIT
jgi:DNA-binding transcriptional LysR family regulator